MGEFSLWYVSLTDPLKRGDRKNRRRGYVVMALSPEIARSYAMEEHRVNSSLDDYAATHVEPWDGRVVSYGHILVDPAEVSAKQTKDTVTTEPRP